MASPFASMTTSDPIPLPFDEGQWIRVRKLTGREHTAAQMAHRLAFARDDQWAGFFKAFIGSGLDSAVIKKALADPLTGYDRHELVRTGVVSWSYAKPIKPVVKKVDGQPDTVEDAIEDLDDDALEFMALEVLRLSKPLLFVATEEEAEDVEVKG